MGKKDKKAIFSIILILGLIFYYQGINGLFGFLKTMGITMWEILKMINMVLIEIIGDSILKFLFKTTITFLIVGFILEFLSISKGTFGKWFGKVAFWLIGFPVSFLLNLLSGLIFK